MAALRESFPGQLDPRNNLRLVGVPEKNMEAFGEWDTRVLYWFAKVQKCGASSVFASTSGDRISFFNGRALYLAKKDGEISRCLPLSMMKAVLTNANFAATDKTAQQEEAHCQDKDLHAQREEQEKATSSATVGATEIGFVAIQMEAPEFDIHIKAQRHVLDTLVSAMYQVVLAKKDAAYTVEFKKTSPTPATLGLLQLERSSDFDLKIYPGTTLQQLRDAMDQVDDEMNATSPASPVREQSPKKTEEEGEQHPPVHDGRFNVDLLTAAQVEACCNAKFAHNHILNGAAVYWAGTVEKFGARGAFSGDDDKKNKDYPSSGERLLILTERHLLVMKPVTNEIRRCFEITEIETVFTNVGYIGGEGGSDGNHLQSVAEAPKTRADTAATVVIDTRSFVVLRPSATSESEGAETFDFYFKATSAKGGASSSAGRLDDLVDTITAHSLYASTGSKQPSVRRVPSAMDSEVKVQLNRPSGFEVVVPAKVQSVEEVKAAATELQGVGMLN